MKLFFISYDAITGAIRGVSDKPISMPGCKNLEKEVEDEEAFFESFNRHRVVDGELIEDFELEVATAKENKILELQAKCQETIYSGFFHTFNEIDYWFSMDAEAQSNFLSAYQVMRDGIVSEIPWTVKVNGSYSRLLVTRPMMEELALAILQHKTNNISKFRDILSPLVTSSTTLEEIQAIIW